MSTTTTRREWLKTGTAVVAGMAIGATAITLVRGQPEPKPYAHFLHKCSDCGHSTAIFSGEVHRCGVFFKERKGRRIRRRWTFGVLTQTQVVCTVFEPKEPPRPAEPNNL